MSLKKNNKSKNPKYRLQPKESNDSEKEQDTQNEFVYGQVDLLDDEFELEEGEQFIKMINSQFGDSVLVITNYNIYQVEFEAKNIYLKSLDIKSKLNKYLN